MVTDIIHEVYCENQFSYFSSFDDYVEKKFLKFKEKYGSKYLLYTVAIDDDCNMAIAIPHPLDEFDPEIAENIVLGRLKRLKGEVKKVKKKYDDKGNLISEIPVYYKPYDEEIEYVIKGTKEIEGFESDNDEKTKKHFN